MRRIGRHFIIAVVGLLAIWGWWWFGTHDPAPLPGEVAARLRAAEATLYIVSDDPISQQQVRQFGAFADQLPTVDCKEQVTVCDTLALDEIPTIIIGQANLEVSGLQTVDELKKLLQQLELW